MKADHTAFNVSGVIEDLQKHRITVDGKTIHTQFAIWLNDAGRPVLRCSFSVGDQVTVEGRQLGNAYFARTIRKKADSARSRSLCFTLDTANRRSLRMAMWSSRMRMGLPSDPME